MKNSMKLLLIAILLCLALGGSIAIFGRVEGEEFCPQRFTVRRFRYYQVPFARYQITPVTFAKSSRGNAVLSAHLKTKKLLGPLGSKLRWDIVYMSDVGSATNRGDAEVLLKYLEQPGAVGAENWLDWTQNKDHQPIAALFWPLIGKMAEEHLYILMPDVFDLARAATSPEEFSERAHAAIPAAIQRLAAAERDRENIARADHLDSVVKEFAPINALSSGDQVIEAEAEPEQVDDE